MSNQPVFWKMRNGRLISDLEAKYDAEDYGCR